jgi:hypothetical protein
VLVVLVVLVLVDILVFDSLTLNRVLRWHD